jgi:hypothetical protein
MPYRTPKEGGIGVVKVGAVAKVYKSTMAIGRACIRPISVGPDAVVDNSVIIDFYIFAVINIYVYVPFAIVHINFIAT